MKKLAKRILGDHDIEKLIGEFLRYGVLLSCVIAIIGGLLYLSQAAHLPIPAYHTFSGEPSFLTSFPEIMKSLLSLNPRAIIQFGVVVLIATPIVRIILSLFSFIVQRDFIYIAITLIVLTIIAISMFSGLKI